MTRILALLVFLLAAVPALAAEEIELYRSDVDVQSNGDLVVTETIRVNAEDRNIRHGIYRDFPIRFQDRQRQYRAEFVRPDFGHARRQAGAGDRPARRRHGARLSRQQGRRPRPRRLHLPAGIPHGPPDPLLRRSRRDLLERDRHRMDLPDPQGGRDDPPAARRAGARHDGLYRRLRLARARTPLRPSPATAMSSPSRRQRRSAPGKASPWP